MTVGGERAEQAEPLIPAHVRYAGAWAEVSQRISTRGQINSYHIAVIVALSAAYVAIQDPVTGSHTATTALDVRWIPAALMPFVSTGFVGWYCHNDAILGLLGLYCSWFEKADHEAGFSSIPAWFYNPPSTTHGGLKYDGIQHIALRQRQLSDYATIVICLISPSLLFITGWLAPKTSINPLYFVATMLYCLGLSFTVYRMRYRRSRYLRGQYNGAAMGWYLPE
jgi:hypothetical protein